MEYANSFSDNQTLISAKEVLRRVQRSKAWLYKQLANNTFPRPVKIGTRAISFVESEVDHWIQEQIYASRGERYENH
ncbi:TPA: AlpA family phage regulatory protein [Escherichia coli]|uniref:AlpA family phage regulatory protein n=5 Tax=Enterobacterales TaxID=91347 RepID=A0A1X9TF48_ECOLX|nr:MULTISPECIES: AlpA family phage regulatory protein [Enterobacteriaceae]EEZ6027255.1 AlpA family phage regulatory protein [Escherichia coli O101]EFB2701947.1 AlpA family phage regulatory protein [Escherichia coli O157:H7]HBX1493250.1 AlpA family phage regulatory protein [Klebsiella pneumoniae]AMU84920.1 dipicolinate synthase [Escherichia coli str. Sanji]APA28003.1 dipicolinate synthase [Escherichia coli]